MEKEFFCEGEGKGGKYLKKENIFCEGEEKEKNIWRRFFVEEKEKEEIIRKGEILFAEEMKNGERKGGKYNSEGRIIVGEQTGRDRNRRLYKGSSRT